MLAQGARADGMSVPAPDSPGGNYTTSDPPIVRAARFGHAQVVKILLDAKANPLARSHGPQGLSAATAAAQFGHLDVLEALPLCARLARGGTHSPIEAAARWGMTQVVRRLIAYAVEAEAGGHPFDLSKSPLGDALGLAARYGHEETVKVLCVSGRLTRADFSAARNEAERWQRQQCVTVLTSMGKLHERV
jgi:hypothetical protein